jgi:hypothetical protein
MPALAELDSKLVNASQDVAAPEVAEPEVAEAAVEISTAGPVPDVAGTGTAVETGATASEQAFGDRPAALAGQSGDLEGGMFTPEDYQAACQAAGTPEKWDTTYAAGYTEARQWAGPQDTKEDNTFTLKSGESASQALKDFIAGPSIADYKTILVALELDEIREGMGDEKFDLLFGSTNADTDGQIPPSQRLQISSGMYSIPFGALMETLADEHDRALRRADEPEAPAVAAQVEDKPLEGGVTAQPAPEMIADELGIQREQELV